MTGTKQIVDSRPSMDETLLKTAEVLAQRGSCSRGKNGAVIASEAGVILSTGYNGSLAGLPHCDHECNCGVDLETEFVIHHPHCKTNGPCQTAVHSEANAIYFAARNGVQVNSAVMYCTCEPCEKCAEAIVQAGITKVFYMKPYTTVPGHRGLKLLRAAGVIVSQEEINFPIA
jgi:dCMP deaminase